MEYKNTALFGAVLKRSAILFHLENVAFIPFTSIFNAFTGWHALTSENDYFIKLAGMLAFIRVDIYKTV